MILSHVIKNIKGHVVKLTQGSVGVSALHDIETQPHFVHDGCIGCDGGH